jgi:hypothetical protein
MGEEGPLGARAGGGSGRRGQAQAYTQDLQRLLGGESARDDATQNQLRLLILNADVLRALDIFGPRPLRRMQTASQGQLPSYFRQLACDSPGSGTGGCFSFPAYGRLE